MLQSSWVSFITLDSNVSPSNFSMEDFVHSTVICMILLNP